VTAAVLLDTHIVLWVRISPEKLTSEERRTLDAAELRYISAVTLWEIAILISLGRVGKDERLLDIPEGFELLPILPGHCKVLTGLALQHRDPFDRMLIAQARFEQLSLLTRDSVILDYGRLGR
jgi:PIN domain nuclease of toxin-antitoxin system